MKIKNILSLIIGFLMIVSSFANVIAGENITLSSLSEQEIIKVYLDEKFWLSPYQSAKVVDYKGMKIRLSEIVTACSTCPTEEGDYKTTCEGKCYSMAYVQVEMPSLCETYSNLDGCTSTGTEFTMNEGETKEVFEAELTLVDISYDTALFVVTKKYYNHGVDVDIKPSYQTVIQGDNAEYIVTVTDKHPVTKCSDNMKCEPLVPYLYKIDVSYLPFATDFPEQISLSAGQEKSFALNVKTTYIKTTATGTESIDDEVHIQTKELVEETAEPQEASTEDYPYSKKYKFSVGATLLGDQNIRDTATASLEIKHDIVIPPFPDEKVSIYLSEGWNLVSLPGKLVNFDGNSCNSKLAGFAYLDGRYVTLQEAKTILGDNFNGFLAKNSFWIYSSEKCTLNAVVKKGLPSVELNNGWNLAPINTQTVGKPLYDLMSNCKIESLYLWDSYNQEWNKLSLDYKFLKSDINKGFLVKSNNYCRLNLPQTILPPEMPEQ